jgi:beta-phosphoglucomutase
VVEDANAGVEAAVAAGMKCLAVGSAAGCPGAHFSADRLGKVSLGELGIAE